MSDDGNELGADPYGICMKCGHGRHRGFACFDKIRFGPQAGERCPCVRKLGPTCDVCGVEARILITEHANDGDRMVCPEPIPCMKRRFALADAAAAPEVSP